jgi:hypothetical protein
MRLPSNAAVGAVASCRAEVLSRSTRRVGRHDGPFGIKKGRTGYGGWAGGTPGPAAVFFWSERSLVTLRALAHGVVGRADGCRQAGCRWVTRRHSRWATGSVPCVIPKTNGTLTGDALPAARGGGSVRSRVRAAPPSRTGSREVAMTGLIARGSPARGFPDRELAAPGRGPRPIPLVLAREN